MSTQPVTLDMSTAQPIATAPVTLDMSTAQPIGSAPQASVGQRLRQNFAEGIGITNDEGAKNFFEHPINTLMGMLDSQGQLAVKAKDAYAKGDYKGALMYGLNYLAPFIGPQTAKAGEQLNQGDIAGGVARTLGAAVPVALASPEVRTAAAAPVRAVAQAAPAALQGAGKAVNTVLAKAPGSIGAAAGATAGGAFFGQPGAEVGGAVGYALGRKLLPQLQIPLERLARALDKAQQTHATTAAADDAVFPGANLPEAPPQELLQAGALQHPGATPPTPPEAALGSIPLRDTTPPGAPVAPVRSLAELQQAVNDALGGKPLQAGVPLKSQIIPATASAAKASALPEGFTPVESSALKGYKYDPAAQQFTTVSNSGQIYTHGEVTPEEAQAFADADSKGKAWNTLRQNHVLVQKNGRPVNPAGLETQTGEIIPKREAGMDDLTDILQKSLEQAKAGKATPAAATSANISPAGASNAVPSTPESAIPSPSGAGEPSARAEIPGPRTPSQPVSSGTATSVHVSEDQSYPAQYQVRELADVQPSHSGITFKPNPKYGLDYANLANKHEVEANASEGFDPSHHLTDAMDAEKGPLVVDESGHPLGNSNENAMTLQRVYRFNADGAAAYKKMLVNKSPQFGVDPMQIMRMKQPVLVRQIADDDLISGTKQSGVEGEQSLPFANQQSQSTQISK